MSQPVKGVSTRVEAARSRKFSIPRTLKVIVFGASLAGAACSSEVVTSDVRRDVAADVARDLASDPALDVFDDVLRDLVGDLTADAPADVAQDPPVDALADGPPAQDLPSKQFCFTNADAGAGTTCPNVSYTMCSPGCSGYCSQNPDAGAGTDCGSRASECPDGCQLQLPI